MIKTILIISAILFIAFILLMFYSCMVVSSRASRIEEKIEETERKNAFWNNMDKFR